MAEPIKIILTAQTAEAGKQLEQFALDFSGSLNDLREAALSLKTLAVDASAVLQQIGGEAGAAMRATAKDAQQDIKETGQAAAEAAEKAGEAGAVGLKKIEDQGARSITILDLVRKGFDRGAATFTANAGTVVGAADQQTRAFGHATAGVGQNRIALMELGHVGRATAESLAFGMSPLRVLALESPRIVQALTFMSVGFTTLAVSAVSIAPLLASSTIAFQSYRAGVQAAQNEALQFAQTQSLVARNLTAVNEAFDKKLIAPEDFAIISRLLTIGTDASLRSAQARLAELGIAHEQIGNYEKLKALETEMHRSAMDHLDAEQARVQDNYDKRLAEITKLVGAGKLVSDQVGKSELAAQEEFNAASDRILKERQAKNFEAIKKDLDETFAFRNERAKMSADEEYQFFAGAMLKEMQDGRISNEQFTEFLLEQNQKRAGALKGETAELERQSALRREIARADLQAKLELIQGNPLLNDAQKNDQTIPILQQLQAQNAERIKELEIRHDSTKDVAAQLEAEKQITDLKQDQAKLALQMQSAQGRDSYIFQISSLIAKLQSEGGSIQMQTASVFGNAWNTTIGSVSKNITGLIEQTTNFRTALLDIARSVAGELIQGFVQMGVRWVLEHTIMAAASKVFHVGEATLHTTLETEKTASTLANSSIRKVAALGEAEAWLASTAMAAAGSVADIPYVGWALAIAAMADVEATGQAIIAASSLAGYASGGRPRVGELSVVGERGAELFVPDTAGTIIPADKTAQMLSGGGGTAGGNSPAMLHKVVVVMDRQGLLNEFKKSDFGQISVAHVFNNRKRAGIPT